MYNNYNESLKHYARENRKKSTKGEGILWSRLKGKQVLGKRFLRQRPVLYYIADFMQPDSKLIIEIDGSSHDEARFTYDRRRQKALETVGFTVMRFSEWVVVHETEVVLQTIYDWLQTHSSFILLSERRRQMPSKLHHCVSHSENEE